MFTVKQTDAAGNVRLIECQHAAIKAGLGMISISMISADGKRLQPLTGWPSDDRNEDMLYIMNSGGATVVALRFRPSAATTMRDGEHVGPHPAEVIFEPEKPLQGRMASAIRGECAA